MTTRARRLAVAALLVAIATPAPVAAVTVSSAKELLCGGSGPHDASVSATLTKSVLTLRFRARDLVPGTPVSCGYTCKDVGLEVQVACGQADASGKWAHRLERPSATCFGFLPFFTTGATGRCQPGIVP
jgi:hypothetical protein